MPAGLANIAPASPTRATPAPPNAAERVEPGRAVRTEPSVCPVRRLSGWALRTTTATPTAQPPFSLQADHIQPRHNPRCDDVAIRCGEAQREAGITGRLIDEVVHAGAGAQRPAEAHRPPRAARGHEGIEFPEHVLILGVQ